MGEKRMDPKQQFSKRLARWTAVYWFFGMTWLSVIMLIEPSVAVYSLYMSIVISVIMLINIYAYNKNSLTEKALLTILDKTRIEVGSKKRETDGDADEEVSNG